jgi:hypothetical protein
MCKIHVKIVTHKSSFYGLQPTNTFNYFDLFQRFILSLCAVYNYSSPSLYRTLRSSGPCWRHSYALEVLKFHENVSPFFLPFFSFFWFFLSFSFFTSFPLSFSVAHWYLPTKSTSMHICMWEATICLSTFI